MPRMIASQDDGYVGRIHFVFLLQFRVALEGTNTRSCYFFNVFRYVICKPIHAPTSCGALVIKREFKVACGVLGSYTRCLFFRQFIGRDLSARVSISNVRNVPYHRVRFQALVLPTNRFSFYGSACQSVKSSAFHTNLRQDSICYFLSVPAFRNAQATTIGCPRRVVPRSFN